MMPESMPWIGQCLGFPSVAMPAERLEDMYPEVYRIVYPKVLNMCCMMDVPGNPEMYPHPRREAVERMVDEIFEQCVCEMGDPEKWRDDEENDRQFVTGIGPGFGRRRLLRDLISILLIRELIRRRPFPYGGFGYQYF